MTFARAPKQRLPLNGWQRRQDTPDTPAFFVKLENDVETDQVVTEEELRLFYKKYGTILRGVKQRAQIEIVAAAKTAGPGYEFAGLDANRTPTFTPVTTPDATGDSTIPNEASFTPSAR